MSIHAKTSSLPCPFHKDDQLTMHHLIIYQVIPGSKLATIGVCLISFARKSGQRNWSRYRADSGGCRSRIAAISISPLHRQRLKGRQIVVTEDPRLHLVWIDDRIFLKPLPQYMMSYVFWNTFMSDPSKDGAAVKLRKAALGYLQTYFYLIQYESDLRIAQDPALCLIPKEVTWPQFCPFTAHLNDINDNEVSGRYHYGEIRLTRLNYYAPILLGKSQYQRVNYQYRAYFVRIQGPLVSTFAFSSILLNYMQVNLAASDSDERYASALLFAGCYWLSTLIGCVAGALLLMLVFLFFFKVIGEWRFAIAYRLRWKKNPQQRPDGPV